MLNWLQKRSLAHYRIDGVWKAGCLAFVLLGLAPAQAMAQRASCNPDLDFTIIDGPVKLGEPFTISANLGAQDIVNGNYMDIHAFGYALSCLGGQNFSNCTFEGTADNRHIIEVLVGEGIVTDCKNSIGAPAQLQFPETNVIPITSVDYPIRVGPNEQCNVKFKVRVNELRTDGETVDTTIRQAMGWPLGGIYKPTMCDNGLTSVASSSISFTVQVPPPDEPGISIDKTANPTTYAADGVGITYTFVVTNTGNVTLTNVNVTDPLPGLGAITCNWAGSSDAGTPAGTLSPGETVSCSAPYTTTQTDVDAGQVDNTATATGTPPSGPNVTDDDPATITSTAQPSIGIDKTANPTTYAADGVGITYTFVVTNTGGVTLTNVNVTDPLPGLGTITCNWAGSSDAATPAGTLSPDETVTCTAPYTTTQDDVNAGKVDNTATATGTPPSGPNVSDDDPATITAVTQPSIQIIKEGSLNLGADNNATPGDLISYTFDVTNTGNVTLDPVVVTDPLPGISAISCPKTALDPAESMQCTATYPITAQDIVNGSRANTATATGTPPSGPDVDDDDPALVTIPTLSLSAADLCVNDAPWAEVDIVLNGLAGVTPGDINYQFIATDGSDEVVKSGTMADGSPDVIQSGGSYYLLWPDSGVVAGPDSGQSGIAPLDSLYGDSWPGWTFDGTDWQFTPNNRVPDLDLRVFVNPEDTVNVDYPPATPTCVPGPRELLVVDKSVVNVMENQDGTLDVTYEVTVTNNGGFSATYDLVDTLMVDEALTATSVVNQVSYLAGSENDNAGTLGTPSVGDFATGATLVTDETLADGKDESFRFTIRFSIDGTETTVEGANCVIDDDNDTNTGLTNYVEVLVDDEVVDDADACAPFPLTPDIQIVKEISIDSGQTWADSAGPVQAPSGALYRLTVSNTGNIDLQTVTVTDPLLGDPNVVSYTFGPLLVGAAPTVITSGEWAVLNVAQVCGVAGNFVNTATATGAWEDPPANPGDTVSDTDQASLQCIGPPEIEIVKKVCLPDGEGHTCYDANDEPYPTVVYDPQNPVAAYYELTVTNVGSVPLVNVTIDDPDFGIEDYFIGNLGIGASTVIDDGDIPALAVLSICDGLGEVANTASATGESAAGAQSTDTDTATVNCVGQPDIEIVKEVSLDGTTWEDVGVSTLPPADVYYRIRVTNTGAVDLVNVLVEDDDLLISEVIGSLAVGETVTLVPENAGVDEILVEDLYMADFCGSTPFEYTNTAMASGDSVLGGNSVNDSDDAVYSCLERIDICETGRPKVLKMMYDGDDDSDNDQGASFQANPASVEFPATPITIKTYNSQDLGTALDVFNNVSVGDMFYVEDPSKSGKIPPNIVIEFWDGDTLLQTIRFHGSCSAPLNVGDEFSAATVIGAVW